MLENPCPCCSEKLYKECCHPYIAGESLAPDPETLMRSRYTAFVINDIEYLKDTWHPETLPEDFDDEPNNWIQLQIIDSDYEDNEGEVEFKAKLIYNNKLEVLHEVSQFEKVDNRWLYHSGEFKNDGNHIKKIKKSEPCPCNSGKLFKNCHANK